MDIGWPAELLTFVARRFLSHSASTLNSGDTGLTLNFGNA